MEDDLLRHACPLEHPPDFAVRVRDRTIRLYTDDSVDIEGETYAVYHEPEENLAARKINLRACDEDTDAQEGWRWAVSQPCVQSYLLWLNWFGWTFVSQDIDLEGHQHGITGAECDQPFVTWPTQDRAAAHLFDAITGGHDCTVDKSRQMGATWLIASMFTWFTLYQPATNFEVLSRTEDQVDNPGDPKSIFWKIDYLIAGLPPWLKPRLTRHTLRLVNEDGKAMLFDGRIPHTPRNLGVTTASMLVIYFFEGK